MKMFDGKKASTEYMSAHTLAFSTPELTLTRFAFWLGDIIPDPADKTKNTPRIMTFMTDQDLEPAVIDDDTYVPTGAVKNASVYTDSAVRFCFECGNKLKSSIKFCGKCGQKQV